MLAVVDLSSLIGFELTSLVQVNLRSLVWDDWASHTGVDLHMLT